MTEFWQHFEPMQSRTVWIDHYLAPMPDGTALSLPLRDFTEFAVAGLILNQASFLVLNTLAPWLASEVRHFAPQVVVGLPTLGHTMGAAVARMLGHHRWVAPSTTRKYWYDDSLSAPLSSITAPAEGPNRERRMWLDPRLLPRLEGKRILLVDDVISTGHSATAGLALLRSAGAEPMALGVAMTQGELWQDIWPATIPVASAFRTPRFQRVDRGWTPITAEPPPA